MKQYVDLLGKKVKDVITGTKGIATAVSFDLYGCIQIVIKKKDGTGDWYDVGRIKILSDKRVLPLPNFKDWKEKGPENKPVI